MPLYISSKIERDLENPAVLDFYVTATADNNSEAVAKVEGLITHRCIQNIPFDDFDCRSAHAGTAHYILECQTQKIATALKLDEDEIDLFQTIVLIEKAEVDEAFRGHRIALRLMREIANIFRNSHVLYLLKAHPTEASLEVTDADCRKLAQYYCSDPALAFKEIDPIELAGWIVSQGSFGIADTDDKFDLDFEISD